jgi:hypothetical protein
VVSDVVIVVVVVVVVVLLAVILFVVVVMVVVLIVVFYRSCSYSTCNSGFIGTSDAEVVPSSYPEIAEKAF